MAFLLSELFWVGVVPCVAAAITMFACRILSARPAAAWAVSLGCGLIVGQLGLAARVGWRSAAVTLMRPHEARDWLPLAVLIAVGISVLVDYAPMSWQRWIAALACLFTIAVPIRLLARIAGRLSLSQQLGTLVLWAGVLALLWWLLLPGRRPAASSVARSQSLVRGGLLVVVAIGMAVTITLSGSFTYGELCGVAAAAITGATGSASALKTSTPRRRSQWDYAASEGADVVTGAAGVLAVMFGSLIMLGYFYGGLPAINAALLYASLVAAGGRVTAGWPPRQGWQIGLRIALCLLPLGIAVAMALSAG